MENDVLVVYFLHMFFFILASFDDFFFDVQVLEGDADDHVVAAKPYSWLNEGFPLFWVTQRFLVLNSGLKTTAVLGN